MHHRPFFWLAAFSIMVAMIIFVVSDGFAFWPGTKPVPAVAR